MSIWYILLLNDLGSKLHIKEEDPSWWYFRLLSYFDQQTLRNQGTHPLQADRETKFQEWEAKKYYRAIRVIEEGEAGLFESTVPWQLHVQLRCQPLYRGVQDRKWIPPEAVEEEIQHADRLRCFGRTDCEGTEDQGSEIKEHSRRSQEIPGQKSRDQGQYFQTAKKYADRASEGFDSNAGSPQNQQL